MAQKSKNQLDENTKKLIAETVKVSKETPKNLLVSLEPVSSEAVKESLKNVESFVNPTISYFDTKKGKGASIMNYSLINRSHTSVSVDLERDGESEILYGIEDELFLKRRVKTPQTNKNYSLLALLCLHTTEDICR